MNIHNASDSGGGSLRDLLGRSPFCGDWQVESAAFSAPP